MSYKSRLANPLASPVWDNSVTARITLCLPIRSAVHRAWVRKMCAVSGPMEMCADVDDGMPMLHRMRMLKGTGAVSESAGTLAEQEVSSQPRGASKGSNDLWKDVPGFGAAVNRSPPDENRQEAGLRSGASLWQPWDPWRDEPIATAASARDAAGGTARREVDVADEAIRGFNNDPATAGQVCPTLHFLHSLFRMFDV